ncbi:MAG: hypothetical protein KY410_08660 [Proteobacteria bacterium]|nr:hypothetical protein [Pseudomonadota bacterium]
MSVVADELLHIRESLSDRVATARLTNWNKFRDWWDALSMANRLAIIKSARIEGQGIEFYPFANFSPAEQDAIARAGMRAWLAARNFPGEMLA